jgi:hypothetical protein
VVTNYKRYPVSTATATANGTGSGLSSRISLEGLAIEMQPFCTVVSHDQSFSESL